MTEESEKEERLNYNMKVITTGCDVKAVLADGTCYYVGAEEKVNNLLSTLMKMFKKVESASTYFTTGDAGAFKHVTRQHVGDIMTAYGPHLKPNASTNFTLTFGEEFHRILNNVALTMQSWK